METAQGTGSAWGAVNHKASTLLEILHTRLELLGNELQVARITLTRKLVLALALVFCVGLGLVMTVIGLIILFWEQRLLVAGLAAATLWIAVIAIFYMLRGGNQQPAPLFNASLAELQEDLRQLKAAAGHQELDPHGRQTR